MLVRPATWWLLPCVLLLAAAPATTFERAALQPSIAGAIGRITPERNLVGTVVKRNGRPLGGALVSIVSAAPRAGTSLASPWCYPDCGRHAVTDARGQFAIRGVDPMWLFTVEVSAKDYLPRPAVLDPRSELRMVIQLAKVGDPNTRTSGRVLLTDGTPAAEAVVTVQDYRIEGPLVGEFKLDRATKTDRDGRFVIVSEQPLLELTVSVEAGGTVNQKRFPLRPGAAENTLQLIQGATVTGRVLRKAQGVEGVAVGLTGFAPRGGNFSYTHEATTDRDGRFTIASVHPEADFYLFTRMHSPGAGNQIAISREIRSPADRQSLDVGELNLHGAHRLRGRVVFDGPPPPGDVLVVAERARVADWQEQPLDAEGHFEFDGLPSESIVLSFHSRGSNLVLGYHLAPQCYSVDYHQRCTLCGRVDENTDVLVLLEPGPSHEYRPGQSRQLAIQVLPGDMRWIEQRRIESQPLRGVPEALVLGLESRAKKREH
jgi:5-hydroxyisourate hydrolase-like protein (transthyretin family)